VRDLVGARRVTVVFDRGGWSPKLFATMIKDGFDILTYRKGRARRINERRFPKDLAAAAARAHFPRDLAAVAAWVRLPRDLAAAAAWVRLLRDLAAAAARAHSPRDLAANETRSPLIGVHKRRFLSGCLRVRCLRSSECI
jgi:hypothetical protein